MIYQESNKYIYSYNGDKYTIYSPNEVTAEKRIKENIETITKLGVDYVSSGALTHSAPILDISLKHLHPID